MTPARLAEIESQLARRGAVPGYKPPEFAWVQELAQALRETQADLAASEARFVQTARELWGCAMALRSARAELVQERGRTDGFRRELEEVEP